MSTWAPCTSSVAGGSSRVHRPSTKPCSPSRPCDAAAAAASNTAALTPSLPRVLHAVAIFHLLALSCGALPSQSCRENHQKPFADTAFAKAAAAYHDDALMACQWAALTQPKPTSDKPMHSLVDCDTTHMTVANALRKACLDAGGVPYCRTELWTMGTAPFAAVKFTECVAEQCDNKEDRLSMERSCSLVASKCSKGGGGAAASCVTPLSKGVKACWAAMGAKCADQITDGESADDGDDSAGDRTVAVIFGLAFALLIVGVIGWALLSNHRRLHGSSSRSAADNSPDGALLAGAGPLSSDPEGLEYAGHSQQHGGATQGSYEAPTAGPR